MDNRLFRDSPLIPHPVLPHRTGWRTLKHSYIALIHESFASREKAHIFICKRNGLDPWTLWRAIKPVYSTRNEGTSAIRSFLRNFINIPISWRRALLQHRVNPSDNKGYLNDVLKWCSEDAENDLRKLIVKKWKQKAINVEYWALVAKETKVLKNRRTKE
jgi:hypothetical protein